MAEYIEREYAVDAVVDVYYNTPDINLSCEKFETAIFKIPAADVAPVRHGCWERVIPSKSAAKWSTRVSCSNCHSAGYAHHKYCPNCGAKMDGGDSDEAD